MPWTCTRISKFHLALDEIHTTRFSLSWHVTLSAGCFRRCEFYDTAHGLYKGTWRVNDQWGQPTCHPFSSYVFPRDPQGTHPTKWGRSQTGRDWDRIHSVSYSSTHRGDNRWTRKGEKGIRLGNGWGKIGSGSRRSTRSSLGASSKQDHGGRRPTPPASRPLRAVWCGRG